MFRFLQAFLSIRVRRATCLAPVVRRSSRKRPSLHLSVLICLREASPTYWRHILWSYGSGPSFRIVIDPREVRNFSLMLCCRFPVRPFYAICSPAPSVRFLYVLIGHQIYCGVAGSVDSARCLSHRMLSCRYLLMWGVLPLHLPGSLK